jgi:ferrous iron transport protein B
MGGLLAILSGLVLHRTLLKGEAAAFVMELPPYHVPALRGCLEHVWGNLKSFLTRAGQVIVLIALLLSLGHVLLDRASGDAERAAAWRVSAGRAMTVMLRPMGISEENWPAAAGLLAGLMAKEAIVGTLEVLYAHEDDALEAAPFDLGLAITDAGRQLVAAYGFAATAATDSAQEGGSAAGGGGLLTAMRRNFGSRSAAFAYLLFVLIYSPCVAALIVLAREAGWRWMLFAVVYQTLLAWMVATVFYQLANCAEAPLRAVLWVGGLAAAAAFGYGLLRIVGKRVVV